MNIINYKEDKYKRMRSFIVFFVGVIEREKFIRMCVGGVWGSKGSMDCSVNFECLRLLEMLRRR